LFLIYFRINILVHQGTFLSKFATLEDKKRWPVLKDEKFEYLFLSKFVDEIPMKLLKYKHEYFYWSEDINYKGILIFREEILN
jgi:hypothetical protein